MPTSNKTPALSLNNWLGTDKPMRSDFTAVSYTHLTLPTIA